MCVNAPGFTPEVMSVTLNKESVMETTFRCFTKEMPVTVWALPAARDTRPLKNINKLS